MTAAGGDEVRGGAKGEVRGGVVLVQQQRLVIAGEGNGGGGGVSYFK
jgi:hypothetical protein